MSQVIINVESNEITSRVFGCFDCNVKAIERAFDVRISNRRASEGDAIVIDGHEGEVALASRVINHLVTLANNGADITDQNVDYAISMVGDGNGDALNQSFGDDCIFVTSKGKPIKAKTVGQKQYVEAIKKNTIVFGIGPAGTGKTYLAVAMAVKALRDKQVSRIILTRPAIEAGEKLGFLPGDLQSKIDPYLRPLYDALYDMMGVENYQRQLEKQVIEIAPLAYMRGRTLDDSFIILDEAQNATPEQMKMFLTRLGFNSKAVITGDLTQTDLPYGQKSGLSVAIKVVNGIDGIAVHYFTDKDVVRHHLVQKIILAYNKYEKENQKKQPEKKEMPKKYSYHKKEEQNQ